MLVRPRGRSARSVATLVAVRVRAIVHVHRLRVEAAAGHHIGSQDVSFACLRTIYALYMLSRRAVLNSSGLGWARWAVVGRQGRVPRHCSLNR